MTAGYLVEPGSKPSPLGALLGSFPNIIFPITNGKMEVSKDYYSWVGRLALNYKFGNQNVYGSVSRGKRPGVLNISPLDTAYFKPDVVAIFKIGIKGFLEQPCYQNFKNRRITSQKISS